MNFFYSPMRRGGLLALHLGQLGMALGNLRKRTQQNVAQALAEAAADLVGDAVRCTLTGAGGRTVDPWINQTPALPPTLTDEFADLYGPQEDPQENLHETWEEEDDPPDWHQLEVPPCGSWSVGLILGLRAAAWTLDRQTGQRPLLTALAVGAASTAIGVMGGPLVIAALRLLDCLLFLNDLKSASQSATLLS